VTYLEEMDKEKKPGIFPRLHQIEIEEAANVAGNRSSTTKLFKGE